MRFKISVTFNGSYRELVKNFCEELVKEGFSKDDIFFDQWHDYLINGIKADSRIRMIYNEDSEMVVVLLSRCYKDKPWTGNVEWRAVLDLINNGNHGRICLLGIDLTLDEFKCIDGLYHSQDIYKSIDNLSAKEIAEFIKKRYEIIITTLSKGQFAEYTLDSGVHTKSTDGKRELCNTHEKGIELKKCVRNNKFENDNSFMNFVFGNSYSEEEYRTTEESIKEAFDQLSKITSNGRSIFAEMVSRSYCSEFGGLVVDLYEIETATGIDSHTLNKELIILCRYKLVSEPDYDNGILCSGIGGVSGYPSIWEDIKCYCEQEKVSLHDVIVEMDYETLGFDK